MCFERCKSGKRIGKLSGVLRSLSDIDRSTPANDLRPSVSCSARKILNVFQRIRLRFFRALRRSSGRTSFASLRRQCQYLNQRVEANGAGLRSFLPIDLYKSTRRERLNLYRCVLTLDAWSTWTLSNDATASHENTVTARHPTASRLRQRHLVRGPQRARFS